MTEFGSGEPAELTPGEDLALIRRLMEDTHGVVAEASAHFVVWGSLVTAALLVTWSAGRGAADIDLGWMWAIAITLGWVFSIAYGSWRETRRGITTLSGRVLAGIWVGQGIALTLLSFLGLATGVLEAGSVNGVFAAVFGAACFATGFLGRLTWLRWAAVAWWAGAAAMLLRPGLHTYPLTAGLLLALVVVPGASLALRSRTGPARRPS